MPRKTKPRRTSRLSLDPWPAELRLCLDQSVFGEEQWKDAIGLTSKSGQTIEMNVNLGNPKRTQLEAVVHESAHVVQFLQEIVSSRFDKETEAYLLQKIVVWALQKIGLDVK